MANRNLLAPAALVLIASPGFSANKTFDQTSDFRDPKTPKGHLNVKLGTYARMQEEPKGTDCDWVMVASEDFDLEDLRKSEVAFFPNALGAERESAMGMSVMLGGTPLSDSFEAALSTQGIRLTRKGGARSPEEDAFSALILSSEHASNAARRRHARLLQPEKPKFPELTGLQLTMEMDRYNEDKAKLGIDAGIQRAEEREAKRRAAWEAEQAEALKASDPEAAKGYALVLYLIDASVNRGAAMWVPYAPVTNSTTGEFVLLKDGKAVLAGRHCSVGAYTASAPKCGRALASAFGIRIDKKS